MVIEGVKLGHEIFKVQLCKVNVRQYFAVKLGVVPFLTWKLWKKVILINILILQKLWPLLKTTRGTLCMNFVACPKIGVFLINFLFYERTDLWYEDLVEYYSTNKPTFLVVC